MVQITGIDVFATHLPMKQSFRISGGVVGDRSQGAPHVYVRVRGETGEEGWGEARPSHRWSYETQESVVTTIRNYLAPQLCNMKVTDFAGIHLVMDKQIAAGVGPGQPIAKAAIDTAIHDLIGRHANKRLPELWFRNFQPETHLSYLISSRDPNEAAAKAQHAKENGYLGIDVKVGFGVERDIEVLEAVSQYAAGQFFRVDANQAYTVADAVKLSRYLERIGVDVFEQPLRADDLLGFRDLRRRVQIPIALDESVWTPRDVVNAMRNEACDYVVIKLTKMGGLSRAKLCGEIARECGLGLLGGGLTESSLGLSASAHLFHYLEIESPVDLNGPMFLADDPTDLGPSVQAGTVVLADEPGVGCRMSLEKLVKYAAV